MPKVLKITTTGEQIPVCIDGDIRIQFEQIYKLIHCDCIEIVRLTPQIVMIVDDEGIINDAKYNRLASLLYCFPICGDVLLAGVQPGDDGYDLSDLPETWLDDILDLHYRKAMEALKPHFIDDLPEVPEI